jgi:rare lipoprotein A
MKQFEFLLPILIILIISGCSSVTKQAKQQEQQAPEYSRKYKYDNDGMDTGSNIDPATVKHPSPKHEPRSRYGNPKSYLVYGKKYYVLKSAKGYKQRGGASWYGKKFHGERTSSGEPYDMYAMSAAHKTLPLPSYVKVTNLDNNKTVIVRVNDRGPFHQGRIIDLSYSAAYQLGVVAKGTGRVEVEAINPSTWQSVKTQVTEKHADRQTSTLLMLKSFIQVGAFGDKSNAQTVVNKLNNQFSQPVLMIKKQIKNKNGEPLLEKWLEVVKVGPFSSQSLLDSALNKLISQGYTQSRQVK